jgi:hypothetical protein
MDWLWEGEWFKNCNCDPGCPCDFNQHPTHANCEGVVAMRIDKGHVDNVDVSGLCWAGVVWWPGRMDEGNGRMQLLIDESASPAQREALVRGLAEGEGDTLMDIVRAVCPTVEEILYVPFEWEFDLSTRTGRVKAGDVLESEVESLQGFGDPPPPYQIVVTIPGGFEYTGDGNSAETALAKTLKVNGAIQYEHENCHSSMAIVRRGALAAR